MLILVLQSLIARCRHIVEEAGMSGSAGDPDCSNLLVTCCIIAVFLYDRKLLVYSIWCKLCLGGQFPHANVLGCGQCSDRRLSVYHRTLVRVMRIHASINRRHMTSSTASLSSAAGKGAFAAVRTGEREH